MGARGVRRQGTRIDGTPSHPARKKEEELIAAPVDEEEKRSGDVNGRPDDLDGSAEETDGGSDDGCFARNKQHRPMGAVRVRPLEGTTMRDETPYYDVSRRHGGRTSRGRDEP